MLEAESLAGTFIVQPQLWLDYVKQLILLAIEAEASQSFVRYHRWR
jgi:hypothetical protein